MVYLKKQKKEKIIYAVDLFALLFLVLFYFSSLTLNPPQPWLTGILKFTNKRYLICGFYPFIVTFDAIDCPHNRLVPVITDIIAARRLVSYFNLLCKINALPTFNTVCINKKNVNVITVLTEGEQTQAILKYNYEHNLKHLTWIRTDFPFNNSHLNVKINKT